MKSLFQNLLFIVLIVAVAGGVFYWYTRAPQDPSAVQTPTGPTQQARVQFLNLLRTLKTISFDTAFFQDPIYQSLLDSNVKITVPSDRGRVNPFLPVDFKAPAP